MRGPQLAEPSSCASRTPTPSEAERSGSRGSSPPCTGWGWTPTRGPTASRSAPTVTARPSIRCGTAVSSTPANAPAEIDARNKAAGIQTPGYDGFCRHRGLDRGRAGPAVPHARRGVVVVQDVMRGEVKFPRRHGRLRGGQGRRRAALRPGQRGGRHRHGHHPCDPGEDLLPTTPKGILVWEALASAGWRTAGPVGRSSRPRHLSPSSPTSPCWSTSNARSCPSGATRWRSSPTGTRAICPMRSSIIWPCSDGAHRTAGDLHSQMIGLVPAGRRQPLAGLLRRGQAHPHERRVHPGHAPRPVHRGLHPWYRGRCPGREPLRRAHLRRPGAAPPREGGRPRRSAGHGRLRLPRRPDIDERRGPGR